jgi:hypothetical protein
MSLLWFIYFTLQEMREKIFIKEKTNMICEKALKRRDEKIRVEKNKIQGVG